MKINVQALVRPERLYSRAEILSRPCPVPAEPGLYAWFFRDVPPNVPSGPVTCEGAMLLYVGISPKAPPANGAKPSRQNLRTRLRYHMRGNAEGSTLRLTLGCLLGPTLGFGLRRVGSGTRLTFAKGEERLSLWLEENALVAWMAHERPWESEPDLITLAQPPLNLEHNGTHPFHDTLCGIRAEARTAARGQPIFGA